MKHDRINEEIKDFRNRNLVPVEEQTRLLTPRIKAENKDLVRFNPDAPKQK